MAFYFKRAETIPRTIRRVVSEQTATAAHELRRATPDIHKGVHNARKCFKKIRSVLRLVRNEMGEQIFKRENNRFRSAGRKLSVARDTEAVIETYHRLIRLYPEMATALSEGGLRDACRQLHDHVSDDEQNLHKRTRALARQLTSVSLRTADWPLAEKGFTAIAPGVERGYRRGRKTMRQASREPSGERLHQWRKRVKDHWYHSRMLRPITPEFMDPRIAKLKKLSDLLGEDHDLLLFRQILASRRQLPGDGARRFERLARERQKALRLQARALGLELYDTAPPVLILKFRHLWDRWKNNGGKKHLF